MFIGEPLDKPYCYVSVDEAKCFCCSCFLICFFLNSFFVFELNQNESRRVLRRDLIQVLVSLFIIISVVFARKGLKARLHRRFLSWQLDAIFVAAKSH